MDSEELKGTLNSGNASYRFIQNILPYSLLFKHVKIKIHKTIIVCGCETWSLDIKRRTYAAGMWEQGAEKNIWTEERWSDRSLQKTT
jgi:hypothetical protein